MNAPIEAAPSILSELPVRFSHLRAYGRSAAHGKHAREVELEPTYAMQRGTAVHALLFGTRKVCGYPGPQRRGKEYDAFVAERPDFEILTMAEYEKAARMAEAVQASGLAMSVLSGECEKTLRFRWNGLDCRATPDCRGPNYLTELKSSTTSDPVRFGWHALRMHYHAQMAMQRTGVDLMPGKCARIQNCFVVCVESAAPFPVTVFRIEERALEAGEKLLMLWAERLKNSEASGVWPPYVECIVPIDIPDDDEPLLVFADEDENGH
jgi:hypothetical protein